MFRPVLNGRSIIQMIDPARDFRGMGRQVTRTGRHMRVMFSVESGADPRSSVARSGFRNDAFNYDFYAFHDVDTRLSSPPFPRFERFFSTRFLESSLDYFASTEMDVCSRSIVSLGKLDYFLPSFFLFSPFFNSDFTSVRRRLLHCRSNDRRERCFCYRLPGSVAAGN